MGGARTRVRVRARDRRRHRRAGQLAAHGDHGPRFSAYRALHGAHRSLGVFRARTADVPQADAHARGRGDGGARDSLWQVSLSDSHCGAGCVLGDIAGEWIVWATAWMIGSTAELGPEYILDLPLAWAFGILFQYFVIAPLRGQVGRLAPLGDAIKSDTLSVLSFEVGLFGWMAVAEYAIWKSPPPIDSSSHWFLMQIGMMLGFVTSWPVNRWLLRHGIKEPMPTV